MIERYNRVGSCLEPPAARKMALLAQCCNANGTQQDAVVQDSDVVALPTGSNSEGGRNIVVNEVGAIVALSWSKEVAAREEEVAAISAATAASQDGLIEFHVILTGGPEDVVGIDVDWGTEGKLKIRKIKDGLIAKWNLDNPSMPVKIDDCIIGLNGFPYVDARGFFDMVKDNTKLDFLISHRE